MTPLRQISWMALALSAVWACSKSSSEQGGPTPPASARSVPELATSPAPKPAESAPQALESAPTPTATATAAPSFRPATTARRTAPEPAPPTGPARDRDRDSGRRTQNLCVRRERQTFLPHAGVDESEHGAGRRQRRRASPREGLRLRRRPRPFQHAQLGQHRQERGCEGARRRYRGRQGGMQIVPRSIQGEVQGRDARPGVLIEA